MAKRNENHYVGCIIGGAIGDAMGAPIEFMRLKTIQDKYGINGVMDYVEYPTGNGEITDDTQMLLFTAEGLLRSLLRARNKGIWGAYPQMCYESYQRWFYTQSNNYKEGVKRFDGWLINQRFLYSRRAPGNTCVTALQSGHAGTMSFPINNSKGCGGIMRVAPAGLLFHHSPSDAFLIGAELAAMTHGHPSGYLSAGFLSALIAFLNNGFSLMDSINQSIGILKTYSGYEETLFSVNNAVDLFHQGQPDFQKVESLGGGWVGEEALSISLYCSLCFENNFERAIHLSINHGGDSDSTGSITGNIVGLLVGEEKIPCRWVEQLSNNDIIKQMGSDLFTEVKGNGYDYFDSEWEKKYTP